MKILYLYAGSRKKLYEAFLRGEQPDTALIGLNHLKESGIDAEFFENDFTEWLRKISFNLTQLPVLPIVRQYDVIFSGAGLLTLFLVKYVFRFSKPKWFIYNTYLSNLLRRNRRGLKAWFVRRAIASADGIICPSTAQREFLEKEGFDSKKLFFIQYGIDKKFYNIEHRMGTDIPKDRYIISAGRDVGRDYPTLIKALQGMDISLVIGALPRNFPERADFSSNIHVNYFTPEKLRELMRDAEFVVIPTIHEEKMVGSDCSGQYVLLESMMLGKAVIVTGRSTLSDYVKDGENGLIVPPEEPEALRKAITYLWNNPAEARRMGEANALKARTLYSTKIFAEKLSQIFKTVLMP